MSFILWSDSQHFTNMVSLTIILSRVIKKRIFHPNYEHLDVGEKNSITGYAVDYDICLLRRVYKLMLNEYWG